jgi:DNA-directed RNA polymerase specialized sigma24 family protein
MTMFRSKNKDKGTSERSNQYTVPCEFASIFTEDADRLYLLALLLTADQSKAEECLVAGLADCIEGNPVFKDWARAWSVRTVIKRAIRIVSPLSQDSATTPAITAIGRPAHAEALIAAVTQMRALDRFVFVLSTLEGIRERECAALLNCPVHTVIETRARALEQFTHISEAQIPDFVQPFLAAQTALAI